MRHICTPVTRATGDAESAGRSLTLMPRFPYRRAISRRFIERLPVPLPSPRSENYLCSSAVLPGQSRCNIHAGLAAPASHALCPAAACVSVHTPTAAVAALLLATFTEQLGPSAFFGARSTGRHGLTAFAGFAGRLAAAPGTIP